MSTIYLNMYYKVCPLNGRSYPEPKDIISDILVFTPDGKLVTDIPYKVNTP